MASITTRRQSRGLSYIVNYRTPDGSQRRKSFTNQREASTFAITIETATSRARSWAQLTTLVATADLPLTRDQRQRIQAILDEVEA